MELLEQTQAAATAAKERVSVLTEIHTAAGGAVAGAAVGAAVNAAITDGPATPAPAIDIDEETADETQDNTYNGAVDEITTAGGVYDDAEEEEEDTEVVHAAVVDTEEEDSPGPAAGVSGHKISDDDEDLL